MKLLFPSLLAIALLQPALAAPPGSTGAAPVTPSWSEGLSTPESVLYDPEADVYLVSNIRGSPLEKDNNGYILVLSPDQKAPPTRLLEGGKNKVTLHAPKGMAISRGTLYVTDIDSVRMFDRKSGKPRGELPVPGATFLNDLAASPDGATLYFSDTGPEPDAKGAKGAGGVYSLKDGRLTELLKGKELGRPNGLAATADTLWVASFGSNELYSIELKTGKKSPSTRLPKGGLDGVVRLPTGELLVSSWEGSAVFRAKPGGEFEQLLGGLSAPADLGYDSKRNRLLVPRFLDNRVETFALTASGAPKASAR